MRQFKVYSRVKTLGREYVSSFYTEADSPAEAIQKAKEWVQKQQMTYVKHVHIVSLK